MKALVSKNLSGLASSPGAALCQLDPTRKCILRCSGLAQRLPTCGICRAFDAGLVGLTRCSTFPESGSLEAAAARQAFLESVRSEAERVCALGFGSAEMFRALNCIAVSHAERTRTNAGSDGETPAHSEFVRELFARVGEVIQAVWSGREGQEYAAPTATTDATDRYRAVLGALKVPVLLVDLNEKLEEANPPACALFRRMGGAGPETLPLREGQRLPLFAEELHRFLESGAAEHCTQCCPQSKSEPLHVDLTFARVGGPQPAWHGVLVTIEDVTSHCQKEHDLQAARNLLLHGIEDLRQTGDALHGEEERYRMLLAAVTSYIYTVHMENGAVSSTIHGRGCTAITGYAPEDFAANPHLWIEMVHSEDREHVRAHIGRLTHGVEVSPLEHRILHRDGSVRWVRDTMVPQRDAGGRLTKYDGLIQDITERKKAEAALRESEEKYRLLFSRDTNAILLFDMETHRCIDSNEAASRMYGYGAEEFSRLTCSAIVAAPEETLLTSGRELDAECESLSMHWHRRKDGTAFPVEVALSRFTLYGRPVVCAIARDISIPIKADEALRQSEARYRSLYNSSRDPIGFFDLNGRFLDANPAFLEKLGYTLEQVRNLAYEDYTSPKWVELEQEIVHTQVLVRGYSDEYEKECIKKDGTVFLASVRLWLLTDEQGKPSGLWSIVRDMTERKQAEGNLLRLAAAVEQVAEAVVITDTRGSIIYVNPAFERITGYSFEEVQGENPRVLKSGNQDASYYDDLWKTIQSGQTWKGRFSNKRKDGGLFEEEATISPVRDASGTIVNYVAVKRDITKEIQLEKQVRQAQKMEAIGTLAGGIAHDFNNILAAIMGFGELAGSELPETGLARQYISEVLTSGNRARDLVRQILTFTREIEESRAPVSVGIIVKEALQLLRATLPTTIQIHAEVDPESAYVYGDPTQLHQVLINLCTNAYHAMREQGGVLRVELRPVDLETERPAILEDLAEGKYLCLSVGDTGHGMDRATLERIFDPFFTTKPVGEGTGMGLSTVHGIVKSHAGKITVSSEPGVGSTFCVYLPSWSEKLEDKAPESKSIPQGRGERILFIDDEEPIVRVWKTTLSRLNYRVTALTSSVEAMALLQAQADEFDLIITDLTMPIMTGLDLAREVHRNRPGLPILLTTGFSESITTERANSVGMREIIMKPCSVRDLAQAIRRHLDTSGDPELSVAGSGRQVELNDPQQGRG